MTLLKTVCCISANRYDDLRNYSNERSIYLAKLRDMIEGPWQKWELEQVDPAINSELNPSQVVTGSAWFECGSGISAECVATALLHLVHKLYIHLVDVSSLPEFAFIFMKWWKLEHERIFLFQVKDALREAAAYDVDPELSPAAQYMRKDMGVAGYKHLLSVGACANHVGCMACMR